MVRSHGDSAASSGDDSAESSYGFQVRSYGGLLVYQNVVCRLQDFRELWFCVGV